MISGLFKKKEKKIDFSDEKLKTGILSPPTPPRTRPEIEQEDEQPTPKLGFSKSEIHKTEVLNNRPYKNLIPTPKLIDKKFELPKFEELKLGRIEKKMLLTSVSKTISKTSSQKPKTLFLQYEDLNLILDNIKLMKRYMASAETTVSNIKDTCRATNAEINTLSDGFERIQRELMFVDKLIFEKKTGW